MPAGLCTPVCAVGREARRSRRFPRTGVQVVNCLGTEPGSLLEQPMFSTAESSLWQPKTPFKKNTD